MCLMFRLIRKVKIVGLFFPLKKVSCSSIWHWKPARTVPLHMHPWHEFGVGENKHFFK